MRAIVTGQIGVDKKQYLKDAMHLAGERGEKEDLTEYIRRIGVELEKHSSRLPSGTWKTAREAKVAAEKGRKLQQCREETAD